MGNVCLKIFRLGDQKNSGIGLSPVNSGIGLSPVNKKSSSSRHRSSSSRHRSSSSRHRSSSSNKEPSMSSKGNIVSYKVAGHIIDIITFPMQIENSQNKWIDFKVYKGMPTTVTHEDFLNFGDHSFVGDIKEATLYTEGDYSEYKVHAFSLSKDSSFIYMNERTLRSLQQLIGNIQINDKQMPLLNTMYDYISYAFFNNNSKNINRYSAHVVDNILVNNLCQIFNKNIKSCGLSKVLHFISISGYYAESLPSQYFDFGKFHQELLVCDPSTTLIRRLDDPKDWDNEEYKKRQNETIKNEVFHIWPSSIKNNKRKSKRVRGLNPNSFSFSSKNSKKHRSIKKMSKKRRSIKKMSKKRRSIKKMSKKRRSIKKMSKKRRSIKKMSKRRRSIKKMNKKHI